MGSYGKTTQTQARSKTSFRVAKYGGELEAKESGDFHTGLNVPSALLG